MIDRMFCNNEALAREGIDTAVVKCEHIKMHPIVTMRH